MNITDIKQDRDYLDKSIIDAGYELEGHSNDAVLGRIMAIVAINYLEHVKQTTHVATLAKETK